MPDTKVLLDSCIWSGAKEVLTEAGYDVRWVGDFLKDPGDEEIIRLAFAEKRILITLDKDFGELAIFRKEPHVGIIRIVDQSSAQHGAVSKMVLEKYILELSHHAIITVDKIRIRIRTES